MNDADAVYATLVLTRTVHFAATFLLFGCSFAMVFLAPPRSPPITPPRRMRHLIRAAALLALVSGVGWLVASLANMTGSFAGVFDPVFLGAYAFETPFGPIAAVRLCLLAALVRPTVLPPRRTSGFAALATLAGLLLVSQAWLGHAAEGGDTPWGVTMIISYACHVLAGAAWVGGLPVLLLSIVDLRSGRGPAGGSAGILAVLDRFSAMAFVAVCVVLISGAANTAFRSGADIGALAATRYGTVLAVKLGFVTAMLILAAHNRFVAMPRLRRASPGSGGRARSIATSICLEITLGLLVLASAAVLGITPPPR